LSRIRRIDGPDQPVLPDGRPELVVHLGDPFIRIDAGGMAVRQAPILFAGQLMGPLTLRPTGRVAIVGIRFCPYGAGALGIGPLGVLSGLTVDAADVSRPLARALERVRETTEDPRVAVGLVQTALARVVRTDRVDPQVRHVVRAIARAHGQVAIDSLASRVSWTRRHLERRFGEVVGIGPKRLARIARFQQALQLLDAAAGPDVPAPGVSTALACGYADQAHFIRDFREFAGATPGAHLLRRAELTELFRAK
jgi:AraC-like DNA-binding protein